MRWFLLSFYLSQSFILAAWQGDFTVDSSYDPDQTAFEVASTLDLYPEAYRFFWNIPALPYDVENVTFSIQVSEWIAGPLEFRGLYQQIRSISGIPGRFSLKDQTRVKPYRQGTNASNQGIGWQSRHSGGFVQYRKGGLMAGTHYQSGSLSAAIHYYYGLVPHKEEGDWYETPIRDAGEMLLFAFMPVWHRAGLSSMLFLSCSPVTSPGFSSILQGQWSAGPFNIEGSARFNSYSYRNGYGQRPLDRAFVETGVQWSWNKYWMMEFHGENGWAVDSLAPQWEGNCVLKRTRNSGFRLRLKYSGSGSVDNPWSSESINASTGWGSGRYKGSLEGGYFSTDRELRLKLIQNGGIFQWGLRCIVNETADLDYVYCRVDFDRWEIRITQQGNLERVELKLTCFF